MSALQINTKKRLPPAQLLRRVSARGDAIKDKRLQLDKPVDLARYRNIYDAVLRYPAARMAAINALADGCHRSNKKWWFDPQTGEPKARNVGELLMLVVSELAEALEGDRKNLSDDKLPHRMMFEVEIADALIRIFDVAVPGGLDLGGAFVEKAAYNAVRSDHKYEARLKPGGKKY